MALIQWSAALSVNVGEIDRQHQELIRMINELNAAMKEGKGKEKLGEIVSSLIRYTGTHFSTEERYFDKFAYRESAKHKKEHGDFVAKVSEFQKAFEEGRIGLSISVMNFLSDWLSDHIMGSDKEYSPLFTDRGLK